MRTCSGLMLLVVGTALLASSSALADEYALDLSAPSAYAGRTEGDVSIDNGGTFETWLYPLPVSTGKNRMIVSRENDYWFFFRDDGTLGMRLELGPGNWQEYTTDPGVLTLDQWQYVAFTYDLSIARVYLNGALVASFTTTGGPIYGRDFQWLHLGTKEESGGWDMFAQSYLDETRVWAIVRTESEIAGDMKRRISVEPDLIAGWRWEQDDVDLVTGVHCPLKNGATYVSSDAPLGCGVTLQSFGEGLAGSWGFVPTLTGSSRSCAPGDSWLYIDWGLGGAYGILWASFGQADYLFFGGHFYIDLSATWTYIPITLNGSPGWPGDGHIHLPLPDLSGDGDFVLYLQATFLDPGAVEGISITSGLEMDVRNPQ